MFDALCKISWTHLLIIVFVVPIWTIAYEPKAIFFYPISTFGVPSTIFDGLKILDTPYLYGNLFRKSTNPYIGDVVIILLYTFNVNAWHVDLVRSLIYISAVQLSQHVYVLHIFVVKQVLRTFLMFWCWTRCLCGSPFSWNLLYNILSLFPQLLLWMMFLLLMSVILPRGNWFFLS